MTNVLTIRPLYFTGFGQGFGIWDEGTQGWAQRCWHSTYQEAAQAVVDLGGPSLLMVPEGFEILSGPARQSFAGAEDFADGVGPLVAVLGLRGQDTEDGVTVVADRAGLAVLYLEDDFTHQWTLCWPRRGRELPGGALFIRSCLAQATLQHLRYLGATMDELPTILEAMGFDQTV